ncbi:sigma-70 family RNA polymerase sigma factor [Erythrobacter sp.]|uniref:sigma-70 family RNA polymerase sigma factor n=1 Tax=Erythrobacter sp. TaxID=1042 RepID=UPI001B1A0AA6|nr:sigma-70 family RNA polymerase sigma factor [Erythrobacter sp.]MBO6527422.1 sigma-70 family RNA polymerase sigma factor [Erythrobacter sp.]MBO6530806.1 sigma-70 family RNA polymerase sigma factor [Erythrobacter sp.]
MKYDHSNFNAQRAYTSETNQRIGKFLPMVRKLAWYYEGSCGASLDVDDLLQAGMIALTECAQRHDRPGEDGFAAYAKMRVRGAMIDLLRSQSPHARGAAAQRRRIDGAIDRLRISLGRDPSAEEIAFAMDISVEEYHDMRTQLATRVVDLEDCYSDANPAFTSEEPDAEARLLEADDREALAEAIASLPERLQLIVKLHFIEELNLTEIAAVLDVSVPRVHQLKSSALSKLRLAIVDR